MNDQTLLDAVNAQLLALAGGPVAEFQEGMHRVRFWDLAKLMDVKTQLENRIAQASGGGIITQPVIGIHD